MHVINSYGLIRDVFYDVCVKNVFAHVVHSYVGFHSCVYSKMFL